MKTKSLYVCAALLIAIPTIAQAGSGRFYCDIDSDGHAHFGPIIVDRTDKQVIVSVEGKGQDKNHKLGTFPISQRYINIRERVIWVDFNIWIDTKGYKTGPDGKSYSRTLNGEPCEMRGYED